MPRTSTGLLMFRRCAGEVQVLLVHPGGPYFINKDDGMWSVPKGEPNVDEDLLTAAKREFHEETGFNATAPFIELKPVKQKGGKVVHTWAFEGDCDLKQFTSNNFQLEWPPKSGKLATFPEVDRAEFFGLAEARRKINPGQVGLLDELEVILGSSRLASNND